MQLPTKHRGATITYVDNDVSPGTMFATIKLDDGRKHRLTERLIRVVSTDPGDRRRTFVAHIIAKIDHKLDEGWVSWPQLMIDDAAREVPGEVAAKCADLLGTV